MHPDTRRRMLNGTITIDQALAEARDLPYYVELDTTERQFLADVLFRAYERDNELRDADRPVLLELRDRIRPPYSRDRGTMGLTRAPEDMGTNDGLGA